MTAANIISFYFWSK